MTGVNEFNLIRDKPVDLEKHVDLLPSRGFQDYTFH